MYELHLKKGVLDPMICCRLRAESDAEAAHEASRIVMMTMLEGYLYAIEEERYRCISGFRPGVSVTVTDRRGG